MAQTQHCGHCEIKFSAQRPSALYCSESCRAAAWRERNYLCFYCGEMASERDHVIPHSLTSHTIRLWSGCDTVQCCRECNSLLGNKIFGRMAERVAELAKLFHKKHKLGTGFIEWSDDELNELGYSLKSYIAGKQKVYWANWKRLNHMRIRAAQLIELREGESVPDVD